MEGGSAREWPALHSSYVGGGTAGRGVRLGRSLVAERSDAADGAGGTPGTMGRAVQAAAASSTWVVVADQKRWVAVLPLVPHRVGWLLPAGGLPTNPWLPCGELLLDPASRRQHHARSAAGCRRRASLAVAVVERGGARGAVLAGIASGVPPDGNGRLLPPAVSGRPRPDRSELGQLSKTFAQKPSSGNESGLAAAEL